MEEKAKYLLITFVLISFALMSIPALAKTTGTAESKGVSSNPIGETIEKTASVKEMQSKPARQLSYIRDVLGNKIPTQTDNSGKR